MSTRTKSPFGKKHRRRKSIYHIDWEQECIHLDCVYELRTSQERLSDSIFLNVTFHESVPQDFPIESCLCEQLEPALVDSYPDLSAEKGLVIDMKEELIVIPENLEELREIEDLEEELLCQTIKIRNAERVENEALSLDHRLQASFLQNLLRKRFDEVFQMLLPVRLYYLRASLILGIDLANSYKVPNMFSLQQLELLLFTKWTVQTG